MWREKITNHTGDHEIDCQPQQQVMPPLSKKRKACLASTAKACEARKARRVPVPDDNSDIELYFDSEEENSELDGGPRGRMLMKN